MSIRMTLKLQEKVMELGLTNQDDIGVLRGALGFSSGNDLHFGMFLPTIMGQGTKEQKKEYLTKALMMQILGTYAQTELGHGTFLRGLETTATYDRQTGEYIIHSPTITASKWWPGGLGKSANHVVLMARLFIEGKDFGPHPFILPIRDLQTHQPLKGIEVGDIGPKFGFNTVDNGFLRFDHVRVPGSALLSKNVQVTPQGEYVRLTNNAKSTYGTMILIRAQIAATAANSLAKAVTIATRYSAVRRQTNNAEGEMENQVLDYQNQQHQLFPLIAATFALHFTGKFMRELFNDYQKNASAGDLDSLPEVHATSSGLKALMTSITSDGIEVCRKSCGGHGFSNYSGLPTLYQDYVAACTYEGENTIMHLQTARYLVKLARGSLKGEKIRGDTKYFEGFQSFSHPKCKAAKEEDLLNIDIQLDAFRYRAAATIYQTVINLDSKINSGEKEHEAWNSSIIDLVKSSKAHCYYLLAHHFTEVVLKMSDSPTKVVVKQLSDLFALSCIDSQLGEFMENGYFSSHQIKWIRSQIKKLLREIRPNTVLIVDSWDLHDYELNSALGRHDGDVYNALFNWAQSAPLNKSHITNTYKQYLLPKFQSNL